MLGAGIAVIYTVFPVSTRIATLAHGSASPDTTRRHAAAHHVWLFFFLTKLLQKTYKQTHTDPIQNIHIDKKIFAAPSHQKHCCSADSMYCVLLYRAIQASHVPPSTTCHKDLGRPHILRCWCFLCSSRSQSQVFGNRPHGTIRAAAASRQQ